LLFESGPARTSIAGRQLIDLIDPFSIALSVEELRARAYMSVATEIFPGRGRLGTHVPRSSSSARLSRIG
jgi:hypothetical protein